MRGTGLTAGVAGAVNTFTIMARDAFHNDIECGGEVFEVDLRQARCSKVANERRSQSDCVADVTDCCDGSYSVSYRVTRSGQYTISLGVVQEDQKAPTLRRAVADFDCFVSAAGPCASSTTADGPGLKQSNAGVRSAFTVRLCDALGNAVANGGGDLSAVLCLSGQSLQQETEIKTRVADKRDGTYLVTYVAFKPGRYRAFIKVGGHNIQGSPYLVHVESGSRS
jgi:hypothetical protein